MAYDDGYGEKQYEPVETPKRMWSDDQIDANSFMVVLLQGTTPPVGMYPFSVATRFCIIIGSMAKLLGIEHSCRVFQDALMGKMGYDYEKVLEGKTEYESRLEGV
jgi:hypothetical protein